MGNEGKDKKINAIIYFIILPIIIILFFVMIGVLFINRNEIKHYSSKTSDGEVLKENFQDIDIKDEMVQKAFKMIDVSYFENVLINIVQDFYSGKELNVDDLTDEQKMFLILNYYTNVHDYYMCSDEFEVKEEDLNNLYFEDNKYLSYFKNNVLDTAGYFAIKYDKNFLVNTNGCYGVEGPTSVYNVNLEKASKSEDKLLIKVRMAYLYQDLETFDENENAFYSVGYNNLDAKGEAIQEKIYDPSEIEWSKYNLYQFEFKIDNDNLYFIGVKLVS